MNWPHNGVGWEFIFGAIGCWWVFIPFWVHLALFSAWVLPWSAEALWMPSPVTIPRTLPQ